MKGKSGSEVAKKTVIREEDENYQVEEKNDAPAAPTDNQSRLTTTAEESFKLFSVNYLKVLNR